MKKTLNHEKLRDEILQIHRSLIAAHLNNDPDHFKGATSDGFLSVARGEIIKPSRVEIETGLKNYIENTNFTEYRDLTEPIIGFSDDNSIAWSIVQVKASGTKRNTGEKIGFTCAWLTLYRREADGWAKITEVSTFK